MVGSKRIVPVSSIIYPLGDPDLPPELERGMRREVVQKALAALQSEN